MNYVDIFVNFCNFIVPSMQQGEGLSYGLQM